MSIPNFNLEGITTNVVGGLLVATILALSRRMFSRREPVQIVVPLPAESSEAPSQELKAKQPVMRRIFVGSVRFLRVPVLAFIAAKLTLGIFVLDIHGFNLLDYTEWLDTVMARLVQFSWLDFVLMLFWAIIFWWILNRPRKAKG